MSWWWNEPYVPGVWQDVGDVVYQPLPLEFAVLGDEGVMEEAFEEAIPVAEKVATDFVRRHSPLPPPKPVTPGTVVGWSPPPHPIDVIVSFDPKASKKEKASAVLLDYYHDNALRSWADDGNVKKCFIGGQDPKKEDHDPLLLVAAYLDPHHKVWKCQGVSWKQLDDAVQSAIGRRMKLGPLPKASYDLGPNNTNPIVIYYYDHDLMKRISYPPMSIPEALRVSLTSPTARYWAVYSGPGDTASTEAGLDKIHTLQTGDPRSIQIERENPGWKNRAELKKILAKYSKDFQQSSDCPSCKGKLGMSMQAGSAGGWGDEGFDWDRDVAGTGIIGSITGAILALVSAVLTATGVGAIIGVPLGIATPLIVAAINELDVGLHTGDFGAGLASLATALLQAAGSAAGAAGVSIPPDAMKALSTTVSVIATAVRAGQEKKLDFAQIWDEAAKKAKGYGNIGDSEAIAIAQMLTGQGPAAGHVFIQGYLAGKFLDIQAIASIAKLLQAYAVFADPRIINLGLLGMGIGYISKTQGGATFRGVPAGVTPGASAAPRSAAAPKAGARRSQRRGAQHASRGDFAGQIFIEGRQAALDDLDAFVVAVLGPRYGLHSHAVGFECPPGFDLVATDHQIACAYRGKAACLAGGTDESGNFVCTSRDFDCPPGMSLRRGSPSNWCFPVGGHATGQAQPPPPPLPQGPPDWSFPALGCPHGYWRDDLSGKCRLIEPSQSLPLPRTSYYDD